MALAMLVLGGIFLAPGSQPAHGQPTSPDSDPKLKATTADDRLAEQRTDTQARLETLEAELADLGEDASRRPQLEAQLETLQRLLQVLERQQQALERREEIELERNALMQERSLQPPALLEVTPPVDLALLDARLDRLAAVETARESAGIAVSTAEEALASSEETFEERERARRRIKEASQKAQTETAIAASEARLARARLESEVAAALQTLAAQELENARLRMETLRQRIELETEIVAWVEANLALGRKDIRDSLEEIQAREDELRTALDRARVDATAAERRLTSTREQFNASAQPEPALVAQLEARRLAQLAAQSRVAIYGERLRRLAEQREWWTRRLDTLRERATRPELIAWQEELEALIGERGRAIRLAEASLAEFRRDLVELRADRLRAAGDSAVGKWLDAQKEELDSLAELYGTELEWLRESLTLPERCLAEIQSRSDRTDLREVLRSAGERIEATWRTEIFAVEDRPITIGKVIIALLLLLLGYVVARLVSWALARLLERRAAVAKGAASAVQTLSFYVFVILFALLALHYVNIPLTVFTVLGGALAIGVGFGSQNIINNFVSGLIILLERPVRVGDIVDVEGTYGRIERIGGRSTRVLSSEGIHIIVPNSAFLEQKVVNWTLSDELVRASVNVGVAYGSPVRRVEELLRDVLEAHKSVLKVPQPVVLFSEFGDNALMFQLLFWVRVRRIMDMRRIQSEVRFLISDAFEEADITIAFPQRDVHLDTVRPLEVRVTK